jgi:hypothetical protein
MKQILFFVALILVNVQLQAQTVVTPKSLKKVMTMTMARTIDDDMPGTNGAAVVWHPVQKKYYAAMAGNAEFPLSVFDSKGKRLSADESACMIDLRGLWYNADKKTIEGNGYGDQGWFSYKMDAKGMLTDTVTLLAGSYQPGEQSVGTYYPLKKRILFVQDDQVFLYNSKTGASTDETLTINFGKTKAQVEGEVEEDVEDMVLLEDYNFTTVIYTGVAGAELGFLNVDKAQIELYSFKGGYHTKTLQLPEDAPALSAGFNFSFANGIYWIFDKEARTWIGYK